ncbi:hypothetical protein Q8A67_025449 [Cirrhinus molitorella]|uniref:Uncharacterized protein n=1 Tax=Cirrhinus molitorella TaxID=172907 RepID=A0AA88NUN4_9TELE|nr:hypothetical protein Q8A67_025449 [Cirrhinus molitorella]
MSVIAGGSQELDNLSKPCSLPARREGNEAQNSGREGDKLDKQLGFKRAGCVCRGEDSWGGQEILAQQQL